jgi:O-methyltransferase
MRGVRPAIVKMLQKARLNRIAHRIYYRYLYGFETRQKEELALLQAIEHCFAKALAFGTATCGDYYEFGLFQGRSFWHAQMTAAKHSLSAMRFYGFDSFKGLPVLTGYDESEDDAFYQGQYACSKDQVIANLDSKGVDWSRTFLIEGFYEQSLNEKTKAKFTMDKAAIALIDCDLYSSAAQALSFLEGMLIDNSILIFDDWNCYYADDQRGERRAFREFLEKNRHYGAAELFSYGTYGQVFLLAVSSSRRC